MLLYNFLLIFLLCVGASLPVLLMLKFLRAFSQKREKEYTQKVSVVVALRNEEDHVKALIQSLQRQKYAALEFILVNDRSTDQTAERLREYTASDARFRILRIASLPAGHSGKKVALTQGIESATGEVILLTDADCRPASTEWVSQMVAPFVREEVGIALGLSPYFPVKNKWLSQVVVLETAWTALQYAGFAAWGWPYMGVGRNLAYRKRLFQENGGFSKWLHVPGGDDDLFVAAHATRKNTVLVASASAFTRSASPPNWQAWWQQKTRHLHSGQFYPLKAKIPPALSLFSSLSFSFGFFALILLGYYTEFALLLWGGKALALWSVARKLNPKSTRYWHLIPTLLFDFLFLLYYLTVGLNARFTKNLTWAPRKNETSQTKQS